MEYGKTVPQFVNLDQITLAVLLNQMQSLIQKIHSLPKCFQAKSTIGKLLDFLGPLILPIKINDTTFYHRTYIAQNIVNNMIGFDFMTKYQLDIPLADSMLTFPAQMTASAPTTLDIPPKTEIIIEEN